MISNRENDSVQNSHLRKEIEVAHMDYLQTTASEKSKEIMRRKPYYLDRKEIDINEKRTES